MESGNESSEADVGFVPSDRDSGSDDESLLPQEENPAEIDGLLQNPGDPEIEGTVTVIKKTQKEDTLK